MVAFAADVDHIVATQNLVAKIEEVIIFPLISFGMSVALLVFFWGVFQYIYKANEPAARTQGQQHMLWGIAGFVVMVSAYALLKIATATFGISIE